MVIRGKGDTVAVVGPFESRDEAEAYCAQSGGVGGAIVDVRVAIMQAPAFAVALDPQR